jgi:pyruvoyl-dependent arginine decarboxylase (PvlArgDC)
MNHGRLLSSCGRTTIGRQAYPGLVQETKDRSYKEQDDQHSEGIASSSKEERSKAKKQGKVGTRVAPRETQEALVTAWLGAKSN